MTGASESLLPPTDRWEHRRGAHARVWAITLSLTLHAAVIYLIGEFLEQRSLRTPEGPFVVNLISVKPDPSPTEQEQPVAQEEPATREEQPPATPAAGAIDAATHGIPEAPPLEPRPPDEIAAPLIEPVHGESAAVDSGSVEPPRRDIAGELARKLLEEMETLSHLPEAVASAPSETVRAVVSTTRQGAEVGITGPLGDRGLIYFEKPPYPSWAREQGVEAEVRFEFRVTPEGNVVGIRTLRKSGHPVYESLARQALERWRFEPLPRGQERLEVGQVPFTWELLSSDPRRQ